jgi:Amt family ammonium transporter
MKKLFTMIGASALMLLLSLGTAFAEAAEATAETAAAIDTGDTTFMLVSAALVMLMTPGLALFYGGMVRTKNVLSTLCKVFLSWDLLLCNGYSGDTRSPSVLI